jgi:hypothetical protein
VERRDAPQIRDILRPFKKENVGQRNGPRVPHPVPFCIDPRRAQHNVSHRIFLLRELGHNQRNLYTLLGEFGREVRRPFVARGSLRATCCDILRSIGADIPVDVGAFFGPGELVWGFISTSMRTDW